MKFWDEIHLNDYDPNVKERQKHLNHYWYTGEYYIGYTKKGEEFFVDEEDFDLIKGFPWRISSRGYVDTHVRINGKRLHISMHRLIMNPEREMYVDHIGGVDSIRDNRRANLRIVDMSQNNINRRTPKHSKSGVTGVSRDTKTGKWFTMINVNKNHIYLGLYDDFNEAVKVRKEAEKKYFGVYSYDSSQEVSEEWRQVYT